MTEAVTEELVVQAVNELLASKRQRFVPVRGDTPLSELNFDSLEVAELFATIEDMSGLELDPDSALALETVADLTRLRPIDAAISSFGLPVGRSPHDSSPEDSHH